ncbi:uncharacterized protein CCOS01_07819 [Colletotrichum costaricense]|uniref:Uncharacterized protein n=1 Tax=Colletotrichum costaricense TaxID=1209916 RepID=A0AAI9YXK8_9PEZI|nr:uncharacterized protein CCOS01_07819 [Colletotrichum costaricense]KAK1527557.1 hypothetical protein CCOS01_07819 [Colletotrichum costaricense]
MDVRKGRKWGANIFVVAEAAGPFGAVIPVFGVATVGSLPARLRGPQAPRGSGDWTVQRMPGFLLGTRILVSFLDQWQQRIRGLSRGWMYSKPGKGISGWEWKAAQEPTAPRRWTTALRRSAVRFGLWAIDATPLLTSSTGPGYLTQHPGSQDTASLNFTSLLTIVIVKTLDMGKEEINAPPHATRAPPVRHTRRKDLRSAQSDVSLWALTLLCIAFPSTQTSTTT